MDYLEINDKIWKIIPKILKECGRKKPDFTEVIQCCYDEKWIKRLKIVNDVYEYYFRYHGSEGMLYYQIKNGEVIPVALSILNERRSLGPNEYYVEHSFYALRKPLKVKILKKSVYMVPAEVGYKFEEKEKEEETVLR